MSSNEVDFTFGLDLLAKLKEAGFVITSKEVRKHGDENIRCDHIVYFRDKPILEILPRKKCHFKCKGIITNGKLITVKRKQDVDKLFDAMIEFRDEIAKKEDGTVPSKNEFNVVAELERRLVLAKQNGEKQFSIRALKKKYKDQFKDIDAWVEKKGFTLSTNSIIIKEAKNE